MTERSKALRAGNPIIRAAGQANIAKAQAARWPNGPGPITHGTSNTMTGRCRKANGGQACAVCLAGDAARWRAWNRRRREGS